MELIFCEINDFNLSLLDLILINNSKLLDFCCFNPIGQDLKVIAVGNAEASAAWVAIVDSQAASIRFELRL